MKRSPRRPFLLTLAALLLTCHLPAQADEQMDAIHKRGRLKVAVYNNFPPYSDAGKGIDVELGRALAAKLGLQAEIIGFLAGEDMGDDLRNMVWKGHYLRGEPADVMMRVPVDPVFAEANEQARIFGTYQQEVMGMARVASRIPAPRGSAAVALEVFTREKIGVEGDTLADSFLGGVLQGRLRANITHFRSVAGATQALKEDSVAAVMAPLGELEAALAGDTRFSVEEARLAELTPKRWAVGMAVKADADDLATALSSALADLQKDGTVEAIFKRHGVALRSN
ncbi:transporter substrate-binding domain-containing protein [Zoogloea sp.]|uniref:substrate-binding periplasmic protein n=1 Tax=Zoogloea sp. TaxID=49181 RepID=UPI001415751E|nr:MAG: transporter substrate-binding domain-containing protein [Zoogloea sp.]